MIINQNLILEGLQAAYDCRRSSSISDPNRWKDISGNNKDIIWSTPPSMSSSGVVFSAHAGTIDQSNGYINMEDEQSLHFWLKPIVTVGRTNFYNQAYGGWGTMTLETNNSIGYYCGDGCNDATPYTGFSNSVINAADNVVVHAVFQRNLTTVNAYTNGVESRTGANPYNQQTACTKPISIGSGYAGNFNGVLYAVQIYNRFMTPDEIKYNYEINKGKFT